ncbi:MAG: hypothetical protein AAF518_26240 [Spirochaetota bacterium]
MLNGNNDTPEENAEDGFTQDKILEIIERAAERSMKDNKQFASPDVEEVDFPGKRKEEDRYTALIETVAEETLQQNQINLLNDTIKRRIEKIIRIYNTNYNAFEIALQCDKLVKEYKKVADLNDWSEIKALFTSQEV